MSNSKQQTTQQQKAKSTRRRAIKNILVSGGTVTSGIVMPQKWARPVIESIILPTHAATTDADSSGTDNTTTCNTSLIIPIDESMTCSQVQNGPNVDSYTIYTLSSESGCLGYTSRICGSCGSTNIYNELGEGEFSIRKVIDGNNSGFEVENSYVGPVATIVFDCANNGSGTAFEEVGLSLISIPDGNGEFCANMFVRLIRGVGELTLVDISIEPGYSC